MTHSTEWQDTAPGKSAGGGPANYAKAIAGGVLAGLGVLYLALADNTVSAQEWVGVAQGAGAAFAVVYGIPNKGSAV